MLRVGLHDAAVHFVVLGIRDMNTGRDRPSIELHGHAHEVRRSLAFDHALVHDCPSPTSDRAHEPALVGHVGDRAAKSDLVLRLRRQKLFVEPRGLPGGRERAELDL